MIRNTDYTATGVDYVVTATGYKEDCKESIIEEPDDLDWFIPKKIPLYTNQNLKRYNRSIRNNLPKKFKRDLSSH